MQLIKALIKLFQVGWWVGKWVGRWVGSMVGGWVILGLILVQENVGNKYSRVNILLGCS